MGTLVRFILLTQCKDCAFQAEGLVLPSLAFEYGMLLLIHLEVTGGRKEGVMVGGIEGQEKEVRGKEVRGTEGRR